MDCLSHPGNVPLPRRVVKRLHSHPRWGRIRPVEAERKRDVLRRLKTARGHLEGIIRMVENDAYCVDVMKQLSGVQSALERVGRIELRNHFENCFSEAIRSGKEGPAIDELMDALVYDRSRR